MGLTVAELETIFTADISKFEQGATKVATRQKALDKLKASIDVEADTTKADSKLSTVDVAARRLDGSRTVVDIDADIKAAEAAIATAKQEVKNLKDQDWTVQVAADTQAAQSKVYALQGDLSRLLSEKATVQVVADTGQAEAQLSAVASDAKSLPKGSVEVDADTSEAGGKIKELGSKISEVGNSSGDELAGGIVAALATIPFAGAVIGIGGAIAKEVMSGFEQEFNLAMLQAQTGLDAPTAARLGRAAGEAYAADFGDSLEDNLNTAKIALQDGLLNPVSTQSAAQQVIQSLEGVSQVLGSEVGETARAVTQLLRTGLVSSADEAFDVIVKGQQDGLNVAGDFLDTLDEYPTKFRNLGLTAPQALGFISQAMQAGARDSDVAADALKEFSIRAVDGSTTTAAGFKLLGLSSQTMAEQIAAGGTSASAGLQTTLDALRGIKDPATQAMAAVDLFGTQAEDLGAALYSMDLKTAGDKFGAFAGAANSALATLSATSKEQIESAQRNIETAANGIEAALAAAFGPDVDKFATWVQSNRAPIMQFLLDMADGAFDAGRALLNSAADGIDGFGKLVNTVGPEVLNMISSILHGLEIVAPLVFAHASHMFDQFKDQAETSFSALADSSSEAADTIRTDLITNGLDPAQAKLDSFALPLVQQAALHDALTNTATDVAGVGVAADGSALQISNFTGTLDLTTTSGKQLNDQIVTVVDAMSKQAAASIAAGESSDDLTTSLQGTRDELINTLEQMGLTADQAGALADSYGAIPSKVETDVEADITEAQAKVNGFITSNSGRRINVTVSASGSIQYQVAGGSVKFFHDGGVALPMASGGVLDPVAQVVPPGTMRIVGDRLDVPEAYIPLDGSARSRAILAETNARMPMAAGGVLSPSGGGDTITQNITVAADLTQLDSLSQIEAFFVNMRRLSRQKSGVTR